MIDIKKYNGVIPDIPDPRDYFVTTTPAQEFPMPIVLPMSRVLDQGKAGRCNTKCDQSGAELCFGKNMSDNLNYGEIVGSMPGSSPRASAQFLIDVGMPSEADDPCNTLETPEIKEYVKARRTKLTTAAKPHRFERYAFLHTVDQIKSVMLQAQKLKGLYIKFTMPYGGPLPDQYGFWDLKSIVNPIGYHEVYIASNEMHGCRQGLIETVKVKNSWGEKWGNKDSGSLMGNAWNGNGYFWTDWEGVLKLDNVIAVWPYAQEQEDDTPIIDGVTFHRSIRLKSPLMQGEDVRWVQERLIAHGITVGVDGKYGEQTEKAVKAFQLAKRLTVDGVVGPVTWAALEKDREQDKPLPDPDPDLRTALRADFRAHLYDALCDIYVWGGQGQTAITESIIKAKETSTTNASRAIAFWKKQLAAGMTGLRMWDCSGLIARWLMDHNLSARDVNCNGLWAMCEEVSIGALQPLDLLFRDKDGDKHHVGVYMGEGLVIEAKGRDDGVVIRGIYAGGKTYWTNAGRLRCLK